MQSQWRAEHTSALRVSVCVSRVTAFWGCGCGQLDRLGLSGRQDAGTAVIGSTWSSRIPWSGMGATREMCVFESSHYVTSDMFLKSVTPPGVAAPRALDPAVCQRRARWLQSALERTTHQHRARSYLSCKGRVPLEHTRAAASSRVSNRCTIRLWGFGADWAREPDDVLHRHQ